MTKKNINTLNKRINTLLDELSDARETINTLERYIEKQKQAKETFKTKATNLLLDFTEEIKQCIQDY